MSRRPRDELQFGSDSFLDVVANIVGILIILIVIAGLKVSQTPVILPRVVAEPESTMTLRRETADEADAPLEPLLAPEDVAPNPAPLAPVAVAVEPRLLPGPPEPPAELAAQAQSLTQDILKLERSQKSVTQKISELHQAEATLREEVAEIQQQETATRQQWKTISQDAESQQTNLRQLHATAEQLLQQIDAETRKQPPLETLEHRVTPLSKVVSGHEQHYRLIDNRVSEIPVTLLTVRLKDQIERRKDWLLKQRSHQGSVGPVAGYSMQYLVQREQLGVLDEARFGPGMIRITVANWRIEPDAELVTENADQALKAGSRFYDSLANAGEGTSLTFWVYPDSFPLYRRLQKFAHEQGFLVAGRPLPHGIPISGSPNGSKSAGQ